MIGWNRGHGRSLETKKAGRSSGTRDRLLSAILSRRAINIDASCRHKRITGMAHTQRGESVSPSAGCCGKNWKKSRYFLAAIVVLHADSGRILFYAAHAGTWHVGVVLVADVSLLPWPLSTSAFGEWTDQDVNDIVSKRNVAIRHRNISDISGPVVGQDVSIENAGHEAGIPFRTTFTIWSPAPWPATCETKEEGNVRNALRFHYTSWPGMC